MKCVTNLRRKLIKYLINEKLDEGWLLKNYVKGGLFSFDINYSGEVKRISGCILTKKQAKFLREYDSCKIYAEGDGEWITKMMDNW